MLINVLFESSDIKLGQKRWRVPKHEPIKKHPQLATFFDDKSKYPSEKVEKELVRLARAGRAIVRRLKKFSEGETKSIGRSKNPLLRSYLKRFRKAKTSKINKK